MTSFRRPFRTRREVGRRTAFLVGGMVLLQYFLNALELVLPTTLMAPAWVASAMVLAVAAFSIGIDKRRGRA